MSSPDDASSRLSSAIDEIFGRGPRPTPGPTGLPHPPPPADWSVDDEDDEQSADPAPSNAPSDSTGARPEAAADTYRLPEIVPATDEARPDAPTLHDGTPTLPMLPGQEPITTPTPVTPPGGPPQVPASAHPTSWADQMAPVTPGGTLRAPGRRPRVRRVTRVLRHIDPWSTFKVGLLFSAVAYVVFLTSGVLLWQVADSTGTLDNVERWFTQFGWETFELKGGEIFHDAWIIGLFGVVGATGGLVLLATLFNLVSDIVGGVRVTVLEEEVVERTISSTRRYVVRRPPLGNEAATPAWDVDGDDADPHPDRRATTPPIADWSIDDDVDDDDPGRDG